MTTESKVLPLEWLRRHVGNAVIDQKDFAELFDISPQSYGQIEKGNTPLSEKRIKILCERFDIDPRFFFTDLPPEKWFIYLNQSNVFADTGAAYNLPGVNFIDSNNSNMDTRKNGLEAMFLRIEIQHLIDRLQSKDNSIEILKKELSDMASEIDLLREELKKSQN